MVNLALIIDSLYPADAEQIPDFHDGDHTQATGEEQEPLL
jgi:hypothetical protein